MIDTDTRLLRPADLTQAAVDSLAGPAARLVAEALAVGPIPDPVAAGDLYRGRHRTTEDVTTRLISAERVATAMRLPFRAPGAALAAPAPTRPFGRAAQLGRALRSLRGAW